MSIILSIAPDEVKNAFIVQGANPNTLEYVRYATNTLQPVILIVSNSSTAFDIQFFPTGSETGLTFKTMDETIVNKLSPITLQRISGSNVNGIKLSVTIDTFGFDTTPLTSRVYDVSFNLVAVTSSNNLPPICASAGQVLTSIVSTCCPGLQAFDTPGVGRVCR